jgi:hypothetical protein
MSRGKTDGKRGPRRRLRHVKGIMSYREYSLPDVLSPRKLEVPNSNGRPFKTIFPGMPHI